MICHDAMSGHILPKENVWSPLLEGILTRSFLSETLIFKFDQA